MTDALKALLEELADHPIEPDGWINRCRWCGVSWPDDPGKSHAPDCLHIRAKAILADLTSVR